MFRCGHLEKLAVRIKFFLWVNWRRWLVGWIGGISGISGTLIWAQKVILNSVQDLPSDQQILKPVQYDDAHNDTSKQGAIAD